MRGKEHLLPIVNKVCYAILGLCLAMIITLVVYQQPVINNTINFDRYFETVYLDSVEDGVSDVQDCIDEGYLAKWQNAYHHHATCEVLNCMLSCEPGMTVIIDDQEFEVIELVYVENITDHQVHRWFYTGCTKIICCTADDLQWSRWVVCLQEI